MGWRDGTTITGQSQTDTAPAAPATTTPLVAAPSTSGWKAGAPIGQPPALPPDPQQGMVNAGNITSKVLNWAWPKEDPSASGAVQTASDLARTAGNTFGLSDQAGALVSAAQRNNLSAAIANLPPALRGVVPMMAPALAAAFQNTAVTPADVEAQRAQSEAARARLGGALSTTAETAGYAPLPAVGIAGKTADALGTAAPIFRKVAGQTVEGATGGALSAAGHDQNPALGAAVGGGTALGLGVTASPFFNWLSKNIATPIGQAAGKLSSPEEVVAATGAAKKSAYDAGDAFTFDASHPVSAYNGAKGALTGPQQQGLSGEMNSAFAGHVKAMNDAGSVSASDMSNYAGGLSDIARSTGNSYDGALAAKVRSNIDFRLGSATPSSGQPVGDALMQIEQARQAAQQNTMAKGITNAKQQLQQEFESPGPWASQQAKFYAPGTAGSDPSVYNPLTQLVRSSGGGGPVDQRTLSHGAGLVGEGLGAAVAGPGGAVAGETGMQLAHPMIKGLSKTFQRSSLQNQLSGLYGPATGMPTTWQPQVGEAIRQATLANEASRGY